MNILVALKNEEAKLQQQLKAIQGAIRALYGSEVSSFRGTTGRRTMSAAAREKISKAAKERWAKYRAASASKRK